ncbi:MAG: hypothetical protein RL637_1472 [Pseudomonadota bacterium]|jgi:threonylcarbamoyladenosine tRNA methylthiotransferase MtaB
MAYIHLKTLGCRLNEAELQTWAQQFINAGHLLTNDIQQAQVVVLNSCAVTQEAVRKSKYHLRQIHHQNPQAHLVVSGCYATLNTEEAAQLLGVDLVISNSEKNELVNKTLSELNLKIQPTFAIEPEAQALFSRGRQRAFIKVQDGCRYRCTFCIVTIARGEENSRSISDIVTEIHLLQQQGIQEVVLTGVHLGGYGSDLNTDLTTLIRAILNDTDIPRLRLGSLEPWELSEDFFDLFKNSRIMPHLHLPLQSGCDSVLKRMARRCKTADFAQLVAQARQSIPDVNITSDIIVGFPAETELEWQHSLAFIQQITFGDLHIFNYSPRIGTKAATLANPVSTIIKKQRCQQLQELAQSMRETFMQQHLNKSVPVLWENQQEINGKSFLLGYTPNYLRIALPINTHSIINTNQITMVKLKQIDSDYLFAENV